MTTAAEKLLSEALRLPTRDRAELARVLATSVDKQTPDVRKGRARWQSLRAASGVIHLGGDAVEDSERLYDG